jgi:hypothetical protein
VKEGKVPAVAIRAMITVIATLALVSLYANVQRFRRDKIEQVIVPPMATPTPSVGPPQ